MVKMVFQEGRFCSCWLRLTSCRDSLGEDVSVRGLLFVEQVARIATSTPMLHIKVVLHASSNKNFN